MGAGLMGAVSIVEGEAEGGEEGEEAGTTATLDDLL